jgi:hypothetical protein
VSIVKYNCAGKIPLSDGTATIEYGRVGRYAERLTRFKQVVRIRTAYTRSVNDTDPSSFNGGLLHKINRGADIYNILDTFIYKALCDEETYYCLSSTCIKGD